MKPNTNITDTLSTIVTYSTLTASCTVKTNPSGENFIPSIAKRMCVTLATLLCVLEIVAIVATADFSQAKTLNATTTALTAPKIQLVIRFANRLTIACAGAVDYLYTLFFAERNFLYLTRSVMLVDGLLKINREHHRKDKKIIWGYLFCSLAFLPQQFHLAYILQPFGTDVVIMYTVSIYINLTLTTNELQYIAFCQIIRSRFSVINRRVETLKSDLKNRKENLENEMELLRVTHHMLARLAEETNAIHDVRLFFSFFCCMTNVLANLYFMIFGEALIFEPADQTEKIRFVVLTFLWAVYYFTRMTLLCLASQMLCKEANSTKAKVGKMSRHACNAGLKEEAMLFVGSLFLTKVELKVARFAPMEVKLIVEVIATSATILVTLLQFQDF